MRMAQKDTGLKQKLTKIRMLLMDVDGVLTEGGILLGSGGEEFKIFDVQDGMGITLARMGDIRVGFITGRSSEVVTQRAKELHVDVCYQGVPNKLKAYQEILNKYNLTDKQVCYMGDDVLELILLKRVGVAVAVDNARSEVKRIADYITKNQGGRGAVRETVELILKAQSRWQGVLDRLETHFES